MARLSHNTYKMSEYVSGISTTSCRAERNLSALKLVVSDLRSRMLSVRLEQTVFLKLNKHLIPGLNKVLVSLHGLKEDRKANVDAAVEVKNSVSGDKSSPIISVVE